MSRFRDRKSSGATETEIGVVLLILIFISFEFFKKRRGGNIKRNIQKATADEIIIKYC